MSPTHNLNLGLTPMIKSESSHQLIDIGANSVTPQQAQYIADELLAELQLLVRIHSRTQARWCIMSKWASQVPEVKI